jgi:hypothetical protein
VHRISGDRNYARFRSVPLSTVTERYEGYSLNYLQILGVGFMPVETGGNFGGDREGYVDFVIWGRRPERAERHGALRRNGEGGLGAVVCAWHYYRGGGWYVSGRTYLGACRRVLTCRGSGYGAIW